MTTHTTAAVTQREPELAGQIVVVIGGSAGIGLETARRARAEGADIILTGRNPDRLERAAAELGALTWTASGRTAISTSICGWPWPSRSTPPAGCGPVARWCSWAAPAAGAGDPACRSLRRAPPRCPP